MCVEERRRQALWDLEHPAFSTVDRPMPHEGVIRESASDKEFWETELRDPSIYERLDGNVAIHKGVSEMVAPAGAADSSG